jgi:hypothetical protein
VLPFHSDLLFEDLNRKPLRGRRGKAGPAMARERSDEALRRWSRTGQAICFFPFSFVKICRDPNRILVEQAQMRRLFIESARVMFSLLGGKTEGLQPVRFCELLGGLGAAFGDTSNRQGDFGPELLWA